MISTIEQLNEVILQAYELHSVGFCYDPRCHIIIFLNAEDDVTSSFYIKPLLEQGVEIGNIKIHIDGVLKELT